MKTSPLIIYDLTSSGTLGDYGAYFVSAHTKSLQAEAQSAVSAAMQGVDLKIPTSSSMKKQPKNNLDAMYVAAYWMALGAMRVRSGWLAQNAADQINLANGYIDSWRITNVAHGVERIAEILNSAAGACKIKGANKEAKVLQKLIVQNVKNAPNPRGLVNRSSRYLGQTLVDLLIPHWLKKNWWVIPVVLGVLIITPPLLRLIGRKRTR